MCCDFRLDSIILASIVRIGDQGAILSGLARCRRIKSVCSGNGARTAPAKRSSRGAYLVDLKQYHGIPIVTAAETLAGMRQPPSRAVSRCEENDDRLFTSGVARGRRRDFSARRMTRAGSRLRDLVAHRVARCRARFVMRGFSVGYQFASRPITLAANAAQRFPN